MIRVKPAPGLKVRHPMTKLHIPEDGLEVDERETYWVRRLLDRDVVLVEPPALVPAHHEPQPHDPQAQVLQTPATKPEKRGAK